MKRFLASLALLVTLAVLLFLGCVVDVRYHVDHGHPDPNRETTLPIVFKAALSPILSDLGIDSASSYVHAFETSNSKVLVETRDSSIDLSDLVLTEVSDLEIASGIDPEFLGEELRFVPLSDVVIGVNVSSHAASDMPALVWAIDLQLCTIQYHAMQYFQVNCTSGAEHVSYHVLLKENQDHDGWLVKSVSRIQETQEE